MSAFPQRSHLRFRCGKSRQSLFTAYVPWRLNFTRLLNLAAPRSEPILRHDQDQNDRLDVYGCQWTQYHTTAQGITRKETIEP